MPNRLSTEYVKVPVSGTVNGAAVDVSADPVFMAILTDLTAEPTADDWKSATWEAAGTGYVACLLVGPDGGSLDFSTATSTVDAHVWVKVADNPETPILGPQRIYFT